MDINWLASYPRSGNTWFSIMLHHYTGWPTYSAMENPSDDPLIKLVGRGGNDRPEKGKSAFVKTHYQHRGAKPAVVLLRDGRDAAVSYAYFLKRVNGENKPVEELLKDILRGNVLFGSWGDWVRWWLVDRRRHSKIIWTFEELISMDGKEILDRTFKALNIPTPNWITTEDPPTLEELKKIYPAFFHRGTSGQYREFDLKEFELLDSSIELFDKIKCIEPEARAKA